MNRRSTILLAAAVIILALTSGAQAYTTERVAPEDASVSVPLSSGAGLQFSARFGGIIWPANWDYAWWYVDGELKETEVVGGQAVTSNFHWSYYTATPGEHTVQVCAQYNALGFPTKTDYLTWAVTLVPHPPIASRVSPDSPVTIQKDRTQAFTASGADPGSGTDTPDIAGIRWYLDGVQQGDFELEPTVLPTIEHTWSHMFDTAGTYQVEAVFYDSYGYSSAGGEAVWTVDVEEQEHKPSAAIVSPSSPLTVYAGSSVTFEVTGTDAGNDLWLCEVSLDGVHQTNASFSGPGSDSTASWTHTFDTPGTYQVEFVPLDLAGDHGSACTWTVNAESHHPSASIVSPGSSATVYAGGSVTFTVEGTDPADDLRLCEVSLDGMPQATTAFSGPASGSTASWTCTFDTAGTHTVEFVPLDLAGNYGSACTWTITAESHDPSGTIVSPTSSVTVLAGAPVTFTLAGTDPAGDLASCEVYLGGVFQGLVPFSDRAGGSTASWTHTFNTPGTYQVELCPRDWLDNSGTAAVWTVVVQADPGQAGLKVLVIQLDAQGRAQGPLADAQVELVGPAAGTPAAGAQGEFAFTGLSPGTYTVNVSKTGYYAQSRNVSLAAGETKDEVFQLAPESPEPSAFDFASPGGKHFIEGMPGDLSFSATVAWNGSPGSVRFKVAGTWHAATITDLGQGMAQATLDIPAPEAIASSTESTIEVTNGEGKTALVTTGVYFYPLPDIVPAWFTDVLGWLPEGSTLTFSPPTKVFTFWKFEAKSGSFKSSAGANFDRQLSFDPWAGTLHGSLGGTGEFNLGSEISGVEVLGRGSVSLSGAVDVAFAGWNPPTITPSWKLSVMGRAGLGAPVVLIVDAVFPPASPAVHSLLKVPVVGDLVSALRLRLYLIAGGELSGIYEGGIGNCFLGTTSLSGSVTLGLEGQVVIKLNRWFLNAEAGVYAGGTGTPEFDLCPEFAFRGLTVRAYIGVFASAYGYRINKEVGMEIPLFGAGDQEKVTALSALPESYVGGDWQPIGDSCLRWGRTNLLAGEGGSGGRLYSLSAQGELSQETILVENVVPLASPAIVSGSSETLILFCLHDPNKPWFAATDIGTVRQADGQPWVLDQIADDQAAEFSPSVVAANSGTTLAAWERVSGDTSDANDPGQIAPHLEIVTAWFDANTDLWSTPEQLTSNARVDHQPVPIALGATRGILWIANEGSATVGDANSGDRLMFVKWSGNAWDEPQTLWSAQKGILGFAFVADGLDEGHVVFAVDEDTDPNTVADCELYLLWTAKGTWQTVLQLTSDFVEDAMPTLVAPNGVPLCVWNADRTLVYSPLHDWNPRPVYREYTAANEALSLDGVTMPGGAAIAYTVQGPNGVDIVASFYDADLDCWSLPRQLTDDEHAETALSLACDADELVIAYLKTQTLRTGMDVEIDGEIHHIENVPQPGRTDLYVLRHGLANDPAVVAESLVLDPANPAPGTTAMIRATVENRGDLPLQDVVALVYDGDPSHGGVAIGDAQVIPGTLIAGGRQDVSVSWNVPPDQKPHEVFIVVDPGLAVEDRDRSNNVLSAPAVLPDLAIETCWSTEVSSTSMALTARVVNTGVIPAGAFDVSWRLGAPDGEQIGTSTIPALISGGAFEAAFTWNTAGHLDGGQHAQVFAVADSANSVPEFDETNNVSSLAVFHLPAASPGAP